MKIYFSAKLVKDYAKVHPDIRKAFDQKIKFLEKDLRHPSLRAKKYDESVGVWQARVNQDYRFYFKIEGDIYKIIAITPHPK